MAGSRTCQGCGAYEDTERTVKAGRQKKTITVRLEPVHLADFGARLLCQTCTEKAYRLNDVWWRQHYRAEPP
jgi:hypothetical protein